MSPGAAGRSAFSERLPGPHGKPRLAAGRAAPPSRSAEAGRCPPGRRALHSPGPRGPGGSPPRPLHEPSHEPRGGSPRTAAPPGAFRGDPARLCGCVGGIAGVWPSPRVTARLPISVTPTRRVWWPAAELHTEGAFASGVHPGAARALAKPGGRATRVPALGCQPGALHLPGLRAPWPPALSPVFGASGSGRPLTLGLSSSGVPSPGPAGKGHPVLRPLGSRGCPPHLKVCKAPLPVRGNSHGFWGSEVDISGGRYSAPCHHGLELRSPLLP